MRVCILGASLSCLTLAKALVNQKINVDIIIQNKPVNLNKTRTIGLSKTNLDYFNKNIINIEKIVWNLKKIEIYSDNLGKESLIDFKNNSKSLFAIFKNFKLYELLEKNLSKNKHFKKVYINKDININVLKKYDLVINTESNNSITQKYFNKKIIKKYNSKAYTTTVTHNKILNNTATQIFTKNGPLAFLPISNNETSIVYSINNTSLKKKNNINKLIQSYNMKYKIQNIDKLEMFELKAVSLRSYFNDKILAFGDLIHRVHPLAGQGFNMTVRDIMFLIKIIKNKIDLGLPLDKSINVEFEKNVRYKNFIFFSGVDLVYEFFNLERKIKSDIISRSVQKIGKTNFINKMFIKIADEGILV